MHINFTKYDPKFSLINKKFKIPKNLKEAFFFIGNDIEIYRQKKRSTIRRMRNPPAKETKLQEITL